MHGTEEQREHPRSPLNARVEVRHPSFGSRICSIGNISNGGMFIKSNGLEFPDIGTVMQVQALDMPVEAVALNVKVVWKQPDGIGVEFCL